MLWKTEKRNQSFALIPGGKKIKQIVKILLSNDLNVDSSELK